MNITILKKEINRNVEHETNRVTFLLDGVEFKIPIVYLKFRDRKINAFIDSPELNRLTDYVSYNYDCDISDFKNFFMYKLYKYSRGVNLDKVDYIDLSNVKMKEVIK